MRNTGRGEYLLKEVQVVPRSSTNAAGRLTDKNLPRKTRLQEKAKDMEAYISDIGGRIQLNSLERNLRRGAADNLYKTMQKNRIAIRGFLKLYKEIFKLDKGIVSLRMAQPEEAAPAPAAPPLPETPEERRARLDRMLAESQARRDEQDASRQARQRDRLRGLRGAYGDRPS